MKVVPLSYCRPLVRVVVIEKFGHLTIKFDMFYSPVLHFINFPSAVWNFPLASLTLG